jgi:hypothetical protein
MAPELLKLHTFKGPLIGLAGIKRVGKDTAFLGIQQRFRYFQRFAFADPMKQAVADALNISREELEERKDEYRHELQTYGANHRLLDQDWWIKRLSSSIDQSDAKAVCITDIRHHNECQWVKDNGGIVIRVRRPSKEQVIDLHESEINVLSLDVDYDVWNHEPTVAGEEGKRAAVSKTVSRVNLIVSGYIFSRHVSRINHHPPMAWEQYAEFGENCC